MEKSYQTPRQWVNADPCLEVPIADGLTFPYPSRLRDTSRSSFLVQAPCRSMRLPDGSRKEGGPLLFPIDGRHVIISQRAFWPAPPASRLPFRRPTRTCAVAAAWLVIAWCGGTAVAQSPAAPIAVRQPSAGVAVEQIAYFPFQDATTPSESKPPEATSPVPSKLSLSLKTPADVAASLEAVMADPSLDAASKQRIAERLQTILGESKSQAADAEALAAVERSLSRMTLDKEKAKREAAEPVESAPEVNGKFLPIERVLENRAKANNELAATQQALQELESAIATRKLRLDKLPAEIAAARKLVESIRQTPVGDVPEDPTGLVREAMEAEREAKLRAAQQKLDLLQRQLMLYEAQTEVLPIQKEALEKHVARAEARLRAWASILRKRRQSEIEADLKTFRAELADKGRDPNDSLIVQLADRWIRTVGETDRVAQELAEETAEAAHWTEELQQETEAIEESRGRSGGLPSSLGLTLQLLKTKLPPTSHFRARINAVNESLEESRQLQTQLELTLEGLVDRRRANIFADALPELQAVSGEITESEAKLISKFIADLTSHQSRLLELQTQLELQREAVAELGALIDANVVWIKNQPAFRWSDFVASWTALRMLVKPSNLLLLSRGLLDGLLRRPGLMLLAILVIGAMVFAGKRLRRRIAEHGRSARSRQSVSLRPTFMATLLSWALVLPLVALLYIIAEALQASGLDDPLTLATSSAFQMVALAVLPVELLRQAVRREGLAVAHFDADDGSLVAVRRWLRILVDVGSPLLLLFIVASLLGRNPSIVALARTTFLAGMLLISLVFYKTFEPKAGIFSARIRQNPDSWMSRLRHVYYVPIVLAPLALAAVAMLGYGSGAAVLVERLYWTLWLCLLAYYIGGLVRRWLLTQRRRLAMAVHRERLEESERIGIGGVEIEPTANLAASEINAQTTRLIQTFLFIAALAGVALIWAPVLPAVQYLNNFGLWDIKDDNGLVIRKITLANLVYTLPIVVLTWASLRNLPGLVEGVLLERLPLDKPARYAITTLGTYALGIIGLAVSAQTLGLRWDNIQWLVAALGVGLGFGLQEIFANFVSGLILLFEQPIRVGDVVTLGDTTGVVARIRMRATTVTNWDRQELIIPNKDLITGRLVNWTLSDSTNRVVINVGVAYGSDTDAACQLLSTICDEHHNVASDPEALVIFEGFGDSTLNISVRCYLTSLDHRLRTIHELHTMINRRFSDAGIEIAFPQRDLHLRSLPPELLQRLGGAVLPAAEHVPSMPSANRQATPAES